LFLLLSLFFRAKLQASIDQHKTYEKIIRDAKQTVNKNDDAYNEEVAKRDALRADTASLKLKVKFLIIFRN
jgi:type VI protein secretion system component VasF